jgi:hypothetical protein
MNTVLRTRSLALLQPKISPAVEMEGAATKSGGLGCIFIESSNVSRFEVGVNNRVGVSG